MPSEARSAYNNPSICAALCTFQDTPISKHKTDPGPQSHLPPPNLVLLFLGILEFPVWKIQDSELSASFSMKLEAGCDGSAEQENLMYFSGNQRRLPAGGDLIRAGQVEELAR